MNKRNRGPRKTRRVKRRRKNYKPALSIYKLASGELKFHDLDVDVTIASAGTVTASLNIIAQGVTESERVGRKCLIRSIGWKFSLNLPATATANSTSDIVRVILFQDKQCNGATATVTGILETADFQSFNNLANKGRFRTLMDRTYAISAQGGTGASATEKVVEDSFYKLCSIPIEYDNTFADGRITTIRTNNIGVLFIAQTGALISLASKFRLRFSDQ